MTEKELYRVSKLIDHMVRLRVEGAGLLEKLLLDYKRLVAPMSPANIPDLVRGLIDGQKLDPPLRVTVPAETNLGETWDGENLSLLDRIKDISPDIKEVVVGRGSVTVESIAQEGRAQNRGG